MSNRTATFTVTDRVATITLDHPPANLLTHRAVQELAEIFEELEKNKSVRCVILTGKGRFFCAGADIHELAEINTARDGKTFAEQGQRLMNRIERSERPVIAAINGTCVGGGLELAMACHIRLAAEDSMLGLPEIKLGLIPGFGGTQRLPRIIGFARAAEMILTGELMTARRMLDWGLLHHVIPAAELPSESQRMASGLATFGSLAVQSALHAIHASRDHSMSEGMAYESSLFGQLCETADKKDAVQSYLEHRHQKMKNPDSKTPLKRAATGDRR